MSRTPGFIPDAVCLFCLSNCKRLLEPLSTPRDIGHPEILLALNEVDHAFGNTDEDGNELKDANQFHEGNASKRTRDKGSGQRQAERHRQQDRPLSRIPEIELVDAIAAQIAVRPATHLLFFWVRLFER